jgi:hypothetical protein
MVIFHSYVSHYQAGYPHDGTSQVPKQRMAWASLRGGIEIDQLNTWQNQGF